MEEGMLRAANGISGIRRWVQERGGWPCRRLDGGLAVGFAGDVCRGVEIGWDEFEATFCSQRGAFVRDDEPDSRHCFVGTADEARRYLSDMYGWSARPPPPAAQVESAILTPGEEQAGLDPRPAGEAR
jgi:hypothetical protein